MKELYKSEKTSTPELLYFRPAKVARMLDISIASFWRLVSKGDIRTIKLSERTTAVSLSDLQAFISSKEAA